jgi:predicted ATPase
MIHKLSIRNFKSIRELDLDCRRVNVFIGEPNAGKTNIMDSLGLLSTGVLRAMNLALRVSSVNDLFEDQGSKNPIYVRWDDRSLVLERTDDGLEFWQEVKGQEGTCSTILGDDFVFINEDGLFDENSVWPVRYYLFSTKLDPSELASNYLTSPFGANLPALLANSREVRQRAAKYFEGGRYKLTIDVSKRQILMSREDDGTLIALPYESSSETLRRMLFYCLAIDTNREQVLVFDEPEAHSFPPYTKTLAERIALDDRGNQFFLTTHSPYMLDSLLSKTPASDLNVVLCRMENFETKIYPLNQEQIDQIKEWSMDAFFNFDRLLPELK